MTTKKTPSEIDAANQRAQKVIEAQKTRQAAQPIDRELYETLVALQAETQGFLDQSQFVRARANAAIARFEGR